MRRRPGRDSERDGTSQTGGLTSASTQLRAGFVLLVGISGGMMALQGGGSLAGVGLMTVGGLIAGGALLWYLHWIAK